MLKKANLVLLFGSQNDNYSLHELDRETINFFN